MRTRSGAVIGVIALCLTIAGFGFRRTGTQELETAIGSLRYRPIEGRLSDLPHAPPPSSRHGSDDEATRVELNVRDAARREVASQGYERRAVVLLLAGERSAAVNQLAQLTSRDGASAKDWSDYAAVLLADTESEDPLRILNALAAVEHALELDSERPEALFNRGIVLEALSFRVAAAKAWNRYLVFDRSSKWADEALRRARELETSNRAARRLSSMKIERAADEGNDLLINDSTIAFPSDARRLAEMTFLPRWGSRVVNGNPDGATYLTASRVIARALERHHGDSFLADTVRAIDTARDPQALAKAHVTHRDALSRRIAMRPYIDDLREANRLFAAHRSPMALVVRYEIATGGGSHLPAEIEELIRLTPTRYRGLVADLHRTRAYIAAADGLIGEALETYREVLETYATLGDEARASSVRSALCALLTHQGDLTAAWRLRFDGLTKAAEGRDERQLMDAIRQAAIDALFEKRWKIGHALLNACFETETGRSLWTEELMVWNAAAAKRAGLHQSARAHLSAARSALAQRGDGIRHDRLVEALRLVEGWLGERPHEAVLDTHVQPAALRGTSVFLMPQLLVERAKAHQARRLDHLAVHDLELAVQMLERNKRRPTFWRIQDAFLSDTTEVYSLLAAARDAEGKSSEAIEVLERLRAHRNDTPLVPLPFLIHQELPSNTVVIHYGLFSGKLVVYAINGRGTARAAVPINAAELERLVSTFEQAILDGDARASRIAGRALHRILIAPVASHIAGPSTIVIVQEPALRQVPFAALLSETGRYLVQDHAIVVAPSIAWFLKSLQRKTTTSRALLAVGNPVIDDRYKALPWLSDAVTEATEVAAMYPSRAMLVGADATKARVIGALAFCDAAHFAVHAVSALGDLPVPFLLLSESPDDDGKLFASDVEKLDLHGVRTVFLAGCRTAAVMGKQTNTRSLADAFLKAGAGSVVGALWEVEDAPTRDLSIAFHHELTKGATPAEALRTAQLAAIHSNGKTRDWASLQLYGSGR